MSAKKLGMLGTCFVIVTLSIYAQQPLQQGQQKMMEVHRELGALNENHGYLKNFVGE